MTRDISVGPVSVIATFSRTRFYLGRRRRGNHCSLRERIPLSPDEADRVGQDYTTVSRQLAKLERLGLVGREAAPSDKRVREAVITRRVREMTNAIDKARDRTLTATLSGWSQKDVATLARLLRQLADCALGRSPNRDFCWGRRGEPEPRTSFFNPQPRERCLPPANLLAR